MHRFDRYLSPTHDNYVEPKLRSQGISCISGHHRAELIRLALRDSDWIQPSRWEISQASFVDFPEVTAWHRRYLKQLVSSEISAEVAERLRVLYVCGADHALRCGLTNGSALRWCDGIVAIGRPGSDDPKLHPSPDPANPLAFVYIERQDPVSSSLIRSLMLRGESIAQYTYPQVIEYMNAHGLSFHRL